MHSISARIKSAFKDLAPTHERTKKVYSAYSREKEKEVLTRSDQSLLTKIRSGHTVLFAAYRNRIDEAKSALCPLCEDGDHDLVHWMTVCAGTLEKRMELFGPDGFNKLASLTKEPLNAIALAKSTLFGDLPGDR